MAWVCVVCCLEWILSFDWLFVLIWGCLFGILTSCGLGLGLFSCGGLSAFVSRGLVFVMCWNLGELAGCDGCFSWWFLVWWFLIWDFFVCLDCGFDDYVLGIWLFAWFGWGDFVDVEAGCLGLCKVEFCRIWYSG